MYTVRTESYCVPLFVLVYEGKRVALVSCYMFWADNIVLDYDLVVGVRYLASSSQFAVDLIDSLFVHQSLFLIRDAHITMQVTDYNQ